VLFSVLWHARSMPKCLIPKAFPDYPCLNLPIQCRKTHYLYGYHMGIIESIIVHVPPRVEYMEL